MTMQAESNTRQRILRSSCVVAAVLALAYTLIGFLLTPWIAKRELPRLVEEKLHYRARIGEIAFDPFTLTLRAGDFALEEMDGRPVLGFGNATVDIEWRSLLRRAWVLSEVRLVNPSLHVEISKQGVVNLAALGPGDGAPSQQPARFAVGHVALENGRIEFEDQREGYYNRLEQLSLALSSLSTLDEEKGSYTLVGQMPSGAKLRWKGELSLLPLAASGTLAIENASLPELNAYLKKYTAARVVAGRADLELPYRFSYADGKLLFTLQDAQLAVHDLNIAGREAQAPFAKLGRLTIDGVDFDLQAHRAAAHALRGTDVVLVAKRSAKGELDLARFFAAPKADSATAESKDNDWQA